MSNFLQVSYVIFSAILVSLAIPNELFLLGSPYIALVALIPLYMAIAKCRSYKTAFWLGMLHTTTVHILSSFWLAFFKDFAIFTLGASAAGTSVIGMILGRMLFLPYAHASAKSTLLENAAIKSYRIPLRIFWFAVVYTLYEWFKSAGLGFLAYPWGTLSSTAFRWHLLMQIADLTGTYGISFLFALCSAVCAEGLLLAEKLPQAPTPHALLASFKNAVHVFVILLALSFVYGAYQYAKPRTPQKKLNAVLVQQNSNPWDEISDNDSIMRSQRLSEEKIKELRARGETADVVVWSESVLRYAFPQAENHYAHAPEDEPLLEFIKRMNTPFIIGGAYLVDSIAHSYNNAALLFDADGNFRASYGKIHLVPFAEVLPGTEYKLVRQLMQRVVGISAGWVAGDQYVCFDMPAQWHGQKQKKNAKIVSLADTMHEQIEKENARPLVRVSTPVCFGDAFPADVCRPLFLHGCEVFINLTDDSWSHTKSAEYQHFVIASYRAIEFRTTLVRSTNAGYSVVVDAAGNILADMPLYEEGAIAASIPVYERQMTVYALLGNWLPALFAIITLAYCAYICSTFYNCQPIAHIFCTL
ncbi:MAG: apolipoprotein N-acyltransferase [Treponema sp.]|nr:apolipoprotein N-acyltransferase [Treponema sp.]